MRILFFPSDRGGGFGHISRCLALAHEATSLGHTCGFVLSDAKYERKVGSGFSVIVTRGRIPFLSRLLGSVGRLRRQTTEPRPLYLMISGLDYQVVRDNLFTAQDVELTLEEYKKAVGNLKPDVLVGDTNLLVWMLGQKVHLPVVQIVRYASHPKTAKLVWWDEPPSNVVPPDSSALFNPILERAGLECITRAEDLLRGDLYIVPSVPEMEPMPQDEKTEYVGALLTAAGSQPEKPWTDGWLVDGIPLVYVTIGGGAGPVGSRLFFSTLVEAFADASARVIVSTAGKFPSSSFSQLPANIRFFDWVPGRMLISMADLVLFHGGYATMMETASEGKPTVVVPFHSEQESNGRRLEQLGAGRVLKLSKEAFKEVKASWPHGTYSYLVQRSFDLSFDELRSAVHDIIGSSEYSVGAQVLRQRIAKYGGALNAVGLIQKCYG